MPAKKDAAKRVVFVTGANGSLGRELVKALIDEGDEVRGLIRTRSMINQLPAGTIPFVGNLADTHVLDEACDGAEMVFHLAAIAREAKSNAGEIMRSNVDGTRNLLEVCKRNKVKRIIFSSTINVYGRKRSELLKETSLMNPTDKYGYSKMIAEQDIIASGVPYTILRIATVYGVGTKTSFFKIFRAIREGNIAIIGSGRNNLALVHSSDLTRAMLMVENDPASKNKVYNVSDGEAHTQESLIELAAKLLGVTKPIGHVNELIVRMLARQRDLESDELRFLTSNRMVDISRIREDLGFEPKVTIEEGGKELVDLFLEKEKEKR
jgi:nucleoside-diphosphate-sugar epimerase